MTLYPSKTGFQNSTQNALQSGIVGRRNMKDRCPHHHTPASTRDAETRF